MKSLSFLFFFMILISSCDKAPIFKNHVEIQLVNETAFDLYDILAVNDLDFGFVGANESSEFKSTTEVNDYNKETLTANIKSSPYYSYSLDCFICGNGINSGPDKVKSGKYTITVKEVFKETNTLDVVFTKWTK